MAPNFEGARMAAIPISTHLFILLVPVLIAAGAVAWYARGRKS